MSSEPIWLTGPRATIIAAVLAIIGIAMTFIHDRKVQQEKKDDALAVITATIKADVRSITLALNKTKLINSFITAYKDGSLPPWADAPRNSDYFQLFDHICEHIGGLQIDFAQSTVEFYTYFKVARDGAEPLYDIRNRAKDPENSEIERESIRNHAKNVLIAMEQCFRTAEFILKWGLSNDQNIPSSKKNPSGEDTSSSEDDLIGQDTSSPENKRKNINAASVAHDMAEDISEALKKV